MSTGIASWWWKCILHQQSYLNRVRTPTMFPGTTRSPNEVLLLKTCRNEWAVCNRVHGALQWPQLEIGFNDSLYRQDVNTQFTQESRATHSQGRQEWWRRKENSSHTLLSGCMPIGGTGWFKSLCLGKKNRSSLGTRRFGCKANWQVRLSWMWVMVCKLWKPKYQWVLTCLHTTHPQSLTNWPWSHFHR